MADNVVAEHSRWIEIPPPLERSRLGSGNDKQRRARQSMVGS